MSKEATVNKGGRKSDSNNKPTPVSKVVKPKTKRYKALINKQEGWTQCFFDKETFEPKHVIPVKARAWTLQYGMSVKAAEWHSQAGTKQELEERLIQWGAKYNQTYLKQNVYTEVIKSSAKKAADLQFKGKNLWYKNAVHHEDERVLSFFFRHTYNLDRY